MRREQIFKAASKLILEKGYHMTTLRDISRETGISLGNLYDYINTKEDILYILHGKTATLVEEATDKKISYVREPVQKLKELIEGELVTVDKYQDLIMCIYQESHALSKSSLKAVLSREEAHIGRFRKVIEEGIDLGMFKPFNPTMLAHIIRMMIDCWVLKRWALRERVSLEEIKRGIVEIVLKGIMHHEKGLV